MKRKAAATRGTAPPEGHRQNEAVKQVAEAMRKARAGFGDDKRPLGSSSFRTERGGQTETQSVRGKLFAARQYDPSRYERIPDPRVYRSADRFARSRIPGSSLSGARETIRDPPFG